MEIINESEENERGQTFPKIPESNLGYQLLQKLGWKGGGLGREGNLGVEEPIVVNKCIGRQGLGIKDVREPHNQKRSHNSHQQKKKRKQPIINDWFIKEFLNSDMNETCVKEELIDEDHQLLQKLCVKHHLEYDFVGPSEHLIIRKPVKQPSAQPGKTITGQQHSCQQQKRLRTQPIINNLFIKTFLASNMKETVVKEELMDEDHRLLQKLCVKYCLEYDFVGPSNYLVIRKLGNQKRTAHRHACQRRKKQRAQLIINDPFIKEFLASDMEETVVKDKFKVENDQCLEKLCNKYFLVYDFVGPSKDLVIRKPVKWASAQLREIQACQEHSDCEWKKLRTQPIITNRFIKEFLASNLKETIVREELIDEDHRLLQKLCLKHHLEYDFVGPSKDLIIRKRVRWASAQLREIQACQEHSDCEWKKLRTQPIITNRFIKEFLASNLKETIVKEELIDEDHRLLQKLCVKHHLEYDFVGPSKHLVIRKPVKKGPTQRREIQAWQQHSCHEQKKKRTQPIITNQFIEEFLASNVKETIVRKELIDKDHQFLQKLCLRYHLEYDFVGPSKHLVIRKPVKCSMESSNPIPSMSMSTKSSNSSLTKIPVVQRSRLLMNALRDATKSVAKSYRHEHLVIKPNRPTVIAVKKSIVSALSEQTKSTDIPQSLGAIKTEENSQQTSLKKESTSMANDRKIHGIDKIVEGKKTIKESFAVECELPNPSLIPMSNYLVEEISRKRKSGNSCDDDETKQKRGKVDNNNAPSPSTFSGLVSLDMGNQPLSSGTTAVSCVSFHQ